MALDELHQAQLTFPPFVPSRVVGEVHWSRGDDGDHARSPARFRIHRPERRHSSANLQRRVADVVESGLFVWFSSASAANARGSVLVYVVNGGATFPWFASMRCERSACTLAEVKGLGRAEVEELLQHPPGPRAARPVQLSEA